MKRKAFYGLALLPLSPLNKGQPTSITTLDPSMTPGLQSLSCHLKVLQRETFNRRLPQLCSSQKTHTHTAYLRSCTVTIVWTHAYLCLRILCNMVHRDADVSHFVCAHFVQRHSLIRDCVCQPCATNRRYATSDIALQASSNWTMRDPVSTFLENIVQWYQDAS